MLQVLSVESHSALLLQMTPMLCGGCRVSHPSLALDRSAAELGWAGVGVRGFDRGGCPPSRRSTALRCRLNGSAGIEGSKLSEVEAAEAASQSRRSAPSRLFAVSQLHAERAQRGRVCGRGEKKDGSTAL